MQTRHATLNSTPAANTPQGETLVWSIPQTARLLSCSVSLCYKLCRAGRIPGVIFLGERRMVVSKMKLLDSLNKGTDSD